MAQFASSPEHKGSPDISVGFILSPAFTLTPFAGFVDALRLAADREDRSRQIHCAWEFLNAEIEPCHASCGLEVMPTEVYGDPCKFDYIVVIGGLLSEGYRHSPKTFEYLKKAADAKVPLVGICTGSFVLAEAGLMNGHRCSVHIAEQQKFIDRFPDSIPVTEANFVIDRGIITCPGSIASIDLAAYLITRHSSETRAKKALYYLLVKPDQPRLTLSDRPYEDLLINASRITVDTVRIMEINIDRQLHLLEIAAMVNTTSLNITRSFKKDLNETPASFWREMRLWHARKMIINGNKPITEIAYETGFSDASHFGKTFKSAFNATPHEYRKKSKANDPDHGGAKT